MKPGPALGRQWLLFTACLLVCFGVWRWAEVVLVPSNTVEAQRKGIPVGNNSDFYARWLGTRELLLHRRDPYSAEITRESQIGYYGRPLDPRSPGEPLDVAAFAYPIPVVFVLAPIVFWPFATAQTIFRWILLLSIASSVPLWMRATGLRSRKMYVIAGMALAISSSPGISSYYKQNPSPLVILFLAGAAASAARHWLALSGFLLALSSIKPQISILFIIFLVLWSAARWPERRRLVWSFCATTAGLLLAAEGVLPHWIPEFVRSARTYGGYSGGEASILRVLLPAIPAYLISGVLLLVFLLLCWRWRKAAAGTEAFARALAWAGALTLVVLPKLSSYNHPLLIPSLLVLLAHRQEIWRAGLLVRAFTRGAFACQVWQWGTASALGLLSLLLPPLRLRFAAGAPQYTLFALPPLTLLAVVAATFALGNGRARSTAVIPQTPAARNE